MVAFPTALEQVFTLQVFLATLSNQLLLPMPC